MKTLVAISFVAVAFFAVPVLAQQCGDGFYMDVQLCPESGGGGWSGEYTFSNGDYLDNPCTAAYDPLFVQYAVDVYEEGWQSETGEQPVLFAEQTTMSGSYAAAGNSESEVAAQQPYSLRKYHKVNTADDFHVVTVIDFDPATRSTTITRETACGNGLPDSAQ